MRVDAVVVGAGPAGGTAALALARSGASVLLLDRVALPRWKVCGACVGPAALAAFEGLGLGGTIDGAGARALTSMELRSGSGVARVRLRGSKALSRSALDRLLADAASAAGATVRWGVRVMDVRATGLGGSGSGLRVTSPPARGVRGPADGEDAGLEVEVRGEDGRKRIQTGVVVDATGVGSPLALDGARVEEDVASDSRVGLGAVFRRGGAELRPGIIRMVVGRRGYVGMVADEHGRLNVAAAVDRDALLELGPGDAVRAVLASAGCDLPADAPESGWRGTPPLTRRPSRAADPGVFRVGDAAGYVEPFTGEGIGWAVSSGVGVTPFVLEAVAGRARAAAEGWRRWHRSSVRRHQRTCLALAAALRYPGLVRAAVGLLSVAPRLADPVVERTGRAVEASPAR